jgi:hypothetical protein
VNDIETQIRETLLRHESEAPAFDVSDARLAAGRTRRRQVLNVAVLGVGALAVVIGVVAGLGGLLRADPGPTVLNQPSPEVTASPEVTPSPRASSVRGWPDMTRNVAGVYSWDATDNPDENEGFMHNGYRPGSGEVSILFEGVPGDLVTHRGRSPITVAGYDGSYRRFVVQDGVGWMNGLPQEEWMVDIEGTTVTIRLIAGHRASKAELAEAHEIIRSIDVEPQDNELGYRLTFTLTTDTWDSG